MESISVSFLNTITSLVEFQLDFQLAPYRGHCCQLQIELYLNYIYYYFFFLFRAGMEDVRSK